MHMLKVTFGSDPGNFEFKLLFLCVFVNEVDASWIKVNVRSKWTRSARKPTSAQLPSRPLIETVLIASIFLARFSPIGDLSLWQQRDNPTDLSIESYQMHWTHKRNTTWFNNMKGWTIFIHSTKDSANTEGPNGGIQGVHLYVVAYSINNNLQIFRW